MALIKLWQSSSKDFLNSAFMFRLNFILFHLAHEQNLSVCVNIAVTYWLVKIHLQKQMLVAACLLFCVHYLNLCGILKSSVNDLSMSCE
jgi:hypothetical protein